MVFIVEQWVWKKEELVSECSFVGMKESEDDKSKLPFASLRRAVSKNSLMSLICLGIGSCVNAESGPK